MSEPEAVPDRWVSTAERMTAAFCIAFSESMSVGEVAEESQRDGKGTISLDFFIPEILSEIHPEWEHESLDGVDPMVLMKTGPRTIKILGLCDLISDQATVPLSIELQADPAGKKVSWCDCKLGEECGGKLLRPRNENRRRKARWVSQIHDQNPPVKWAYEVCFGERMK